MPFITKTFKVLISCPKDIQEEKDTVKQAIMEWNSINSHRENIVFLPMSWDINSAPKMSNSGPQKIINKQLTDKADYVIAIFRSRLGTATESFMSGTVEEIAKVHKRGKPASVYFLNDINSINNIDTDQLSRLQEYKAKLKGLYHEVDDSSKLGGVVKEHLTIQLDSEDYFIESEIENPEFAEIGFQDKSYQSSESKVKLSDEAENLLVEAAKDSVGHIHSTGVVTGHIIKTKEKQFTDGSDKRELAKWKAAIEELKNDGLIEALTIEEDLFEITHKGYQYIDI